ncbi:MAG: rubrerythrin family protein [Christensenellales bacterium]
MVDFEKSQTKKNLARAFAGECQDGARYQFLSQQAKTDNLNYMMGLLKTLAKNEMSHAKVFYDFLLKYGNGNKNIDIDAGFPYSTYQLDPGLKLASDAENSQFESVYPAFAREARDEGYDDVADQFLRIATVEDCHSKQLMELYTKLKKNKLYKEQSAKKWKCSKCGYEETKKEPDKNCPLCHYGIGYCIISLQDE